MAFSIEQILGYVPLTKAVEKVKAGVPRTLPPAFYARPKADQVLGDKALNIAYSGTRKVARLAPYGSPPRQITQLPREAQPVVLLHSIENLPFKQELFLQLRNLEDYTVQRMAATEIAFQASQAGMRFVNLETTAVHMMLANGKLWFDASGNLLPSSSGADLTIDYGVPAGNQNQINWNGGGNIIDASWGTSTTKIVSHIKKIKRAAVLLTGYPLKYAIYGANIPEYLALNGTFQNYLRYHPQFREQFVDAAEIADGTLGLTWIDGSNLFFDDDSGTTQQIVQDDGIIFCPDVADNRAYTIHEGSYPVPKSLTMAQDVESMLANFEIQYGPFGYAMMNPPSQIIGVYGGVQIDGRSTVASNGTGS